MVKLANMTAAQLASYRARLAAAKNARAPVSALRRESAARAKAAKQVAEAQAKAARILQRAEAKAAKMSKPKRVMSPAQRAAAMRNLEKARAARETKRQLGFFNL